MSNAAYVGSVWITWGVMRIPYVRELFLRRTFTAKIWVALDNQPTSLCCGFWENVFVKILSEDFKRFIFKKHPLKILYFLIFISSSRCTVHYVFFFCLYLIKKNIKYTERQRKHSITCLIKVFADDNFKGNNWLATSGHTSYCLPCWVTPWYFSLER